MFYSSAPFLSLAKSRWLLSGLLCSLVLLLLCSPPAVHAQWEADKRLTFYGSGKDMGLYNNYRCISACGDTIHVVWDDDRDGFTKIFYKRSTDGGSTWAKDTSFNDSYSDAMFPSVAVSGSIVHVGWEDGRDGKNEIYYNRSTDGGSTWGSDFRLSYHQIQSYGPSVAASGMCVYVVWWDNQFGLSNYPLYFKRSSDGGKTWGPDILLCGNALWEAGACVSAFASYVHVIWQDARRRQGHSPDIFYKRSTDYGATWGPDIPLSEDSASCFSYFPMVEASNKNVDVAWNDNRDGEYDEIYHKRSTDEGTTWGPDQRLTYDTCYSYVPTLAVSGSNIHLAWYDYWPWDSVNQFYYKFSSDGGTNWSAETCLTNQSSSYLYPVPFLAVSGAKVHMVWADDRTGTMEIYYKRNPTGNSGVEELSSFHLTSYTSRLMVSPNPFTSFTRVPGHEGKAFSLFDISGRKVGVYPGDRIGWDVSPGIYFLRYDTRYAAPDTRILRIVKFR